MEMQVLLVEKATMTGHEVRSILDPLRFKLHHAHLGEEGLDLATLYDYDIIVLDLDLPDMGGHEVLRALRAAKNKTPVIMVSKPCEVEVKVMSLNLGADDHVVKPIDKDELIARIHAIVRRYAGQSENIIHAGRLSINIDTKSAQVHGKSVHLTKTQYQLLEALILKKGKVLTREKLLDSLYNGGEDVDYRTIDVMVGRLRKKLGGNLIQTIRGYGYMLIVLEENK